MTLLFLIATVVLLVWLAGRALRAANSVPELDDERGHLLVEALYRDGMRQGYQRALTYQLEAEGHRVRAFVRRRTLTMTAAAGGGLLTAALPLAASVGALPNQAAWLPAWPQWQWLLLALLVLAFYIALGALLAPRDYRKFSSSMQAAGAEFRKPNAELGGMAGAEAKGKMNAMKAYITALAQDRYEQGVKRGQAQDAAGIQTRISSAANAAYVQGRTDGAVEARAQVSQLTTESYLRGVGDGERSAATKLEARIRSEREAAYQSGYRVGLSEGRTSAARTARSSPPPGGAATPQRPRTLSDALLIFELTEGASPDEVRKRYRELQTALHPDALKGRKAPKVMVRFAEEQFKLVGEAYEILQRRF